MERKEGEPHPLDNYTKQEILSKMCIKVQGPSNFSDETKIKLIHLIKPHRFLYDEYETGHSNAREYNQKRKYIWLLIDFKMGFPYGTSQKLWQNIRISNKITILRELQFLSDPSDVNRVPISNIYIDREQLYAIYDKCGTVVALENGGKNKRKMTTEDNDCILVDKPIETIDLRPPEEVATTSGASVAANLPPTKKRKISEVEQNIGSDMQKIVASNYRFKKIVKKSFKTSIMEAIDNTLKMVESIANENHYDVEKTLHLTRCALEHVVKQM